MAGGVLLWWLLVCFHEGRGFGRLGDTGISLDLSLDCGNNSGSRLRGTGSGQVGWQVSQGCTSVLIRSAGQPARWQVWMTASAVAA